MVEASSAPQQENPYGPPGPQPLVFEGFAGLNTQPSRPGIGDDQCSILDGWMPIGKNNARTIPGLSPARYAPGGGKTIIWCGFGNISTNPYAIIALSDGSLVSLRTDTLATSTIAAAGFINPVIGLIGLSQWGAQYILLINSFGYLIWDGTILYFGNSASNNGSLAPGVTVTNGGASYTSVPTVSFAGGTGTGAAATATLSGGSVNTVSLTSAGSGYVNGDFTVSKVAMTAGGSGYTSPPTVSFSGPGAGATATASIFAGAVTGVTITNGGSGYQTSNPPAVAFTGGGGTGAGATATVAFGVIPVIFSGGVGTGATATATVAGGAVTAINVTAGGTGYSSAFPPTISLDPLATGGHGATAVATVVAGAVTAVAVTAGGTGYTAPPIVIFKAGGATGVANLMPFGLTGSAIEVYQSRVWTVSGSGITFSAPGSVFDFSTASGGGSFQSNDSFLRVSFTKLRQTNGFLYLIADSSINYISGVQTSGTPPTTTFTNQNADPEIGSAWGGTVEVFSRNIILANPWGAFISYGGAVTKISEPLDGLYNTVGKAANGFAFGVFQPSAAKAIMYGKRVWALLLTVIDQVSLTGKTKLLIFDGKSWFTSDQDISLTFIASQEVNSVQYAWGTDGTSLYQLFFQPSTAFLKTIQSKLWAQPGGMHMVKTAGRVWGIAQYNTILSPSLTVRVDNEAGISSQFITWTAGATGPIAFPPFAVGQQGVLSGLTLQTFEGDLQLVSVALASEPHAYRG